MNEEPTSIQCGEHGEAAPTYVCGHLCRHPVQRWFCDAPSPDTPNPAPTPVEAADASMDVGTDVALAPPADAATAQDNAATAADSAASAPQALIRQR